MKFIQTKNTPAVNALYADFFGENKPARVTLEVARLLKDVKIEIDAITVC